VDDEQPVLNAIHRAFRGKYRVSLPSSAEEGLALLQKDGLFAVVVSGGKFQFKKNAEGAGIPTSVGA
jgi:hypothetical protein